MQCILKKEGCQVFDISLISCQYLGSYRCCSTFRSHIRNHKLGIAVSIAISSETELQVFNWFFFQCNLCSYLSTFLCFSCNKPERIVTKPSQRLTFAIISAILLTGLLKLTAKFQEDVVSSRTVCRGRSPHKCLALYKMHFIKLFGLHKAQQQ